MLEPLTLDAYFDKIFYINLNRDIVRNQNILNQFGEFGIVNFERIEATELAELPDRVQYRNFIKHDLKYILGSLSCRASHLACIRAAKERMYKQIFILEDDVIFLHDPSMLLSQNYGALHEWDMLYFGGLIEPYFRNQIVCAHAYAVKNTLYDDIINMADASGMEIDNFYAKILQHMSYNHNKSGKYNISLILPFNMVVQNKTTASNIQS